MMPLYSLLLTGGLVFSAPVWGFRMLREGRYREGLGQRLGIVPKALVEAIQGRRVIWIHAVSVGETEAAAKLVAELQQALPKVFVVVSTTTATGQAVARQRFGAHRVFFYPLDFAFSVRAYLRALRPALVVLMESEIWPRMLLECERAGIPVAVANARVSDRSLPRYLRLRRLWRPLLAKVSLLLAQSAVDAERWIAIGASPGRVHTLGNIKYDVSAMAGTTLVHLLREHLPSSAKVLVAGSTHPGEEAMLLQCAAAQPVDFQLFLAPRHPQRTAEVAAQVSAVGLVPVLLTGWRNSPRALSQGEVLLIDTVGELAGLYSLATAAFVGGSLASAGGHNPLEPARFGIPVLMGPHFENFRDIVHAMQAAGALCIVQPAELCRAVAQAMQALSDDAQAERTRSFFDRNAGAARRTAEALLALLPPETAA